MKSEDINKAILDLAEVAAETYQEAMESDYSEVVAYAYGMLENMRAVMILFGLEVWAMDYAITQIKNKLNELDKNER